MSESVHSQGSEPAGSDGSSHSTPEEQSDDEGIPSDASEYEDEASDEKKEDLSGSENGRRYFREEGVAFRSADTESRSRRFLDLK